MSKVDVSEAVEEIAKRFRLKLDCDCARYERGAISKSLWPPCNECDLRAYLTNLITTERARQAQKIKDLLDVEAWADVPRNDGEAIDRVRKYVKDILDSKPTKGGG